MIICNSLSKPANKEGNLFSKLFISNLWLSLSVISLRFMRKGDFSLLSDCTKYRSVPIENISDYTLTYDFSDISGAANYKFGII